MIAADAASDDLPGGKVMIALWESLQGSDKQRLSARSPHAPACRDGTLPSASAAQISAAVHTCALRDRVRCGNLVGFAFGKLHSFRMPDGRVPSLRPFTRSVLITRKRNHNAQRAHNFRVSGIITRIGAHNFRASGIITRNALITSAPAES